MKAMVCELCGSNEFIKQDGMYICQHCNTKYTPEEAKKLMVEGTVKVDETEKISNYLTMAENAYESGNKPEAENYCNRIIEVDADNYKAWLIKGKSSGWQSTMANQRIDESLNCFEKAVKLAPEEEKSSVQAEVASEMDSLCLAIVSLACDHYAELPIEKNATQIIDTVEKVAMCVIQLYLKCGASGKNDELYVIIEDTIHKGVMKGYQNSVKDYWGVTRHPSGNDLNKYYTRSMTATALLEYAIGINSKGDKNRHIPVYKDIIKILKDLEPAGSYSVENGDWVKSSGWNKETKQKLIDKMMECHRKINEIDPTYVVPVAPKPSSGCYVATAVYGSYDCPQVWTLRRYRDDTLAKTWYGRAFIHTYYAISPTLVKWFGSTDWFRNMWKPKLDRMVSNLNSEGVEDTPYEDKNW